VAAKWLQLNISAACSGIITGLKGLVMTPTSYAHRMETVLGHLVSSVSAYSQEAADFV
jgi:hypothetical protein